MRGQYHNMYSRGEAKGVAHMRLPYTTHNYTMITFLDCLSHLLLEALGILVDGCISYKVRLEDKLHVLGLL